MREPVENVDIMDDDRRTTQAQADGETLRTFLDRGPIVAFIRDDCGRYVYVNPAMEQQFGVLAADLEGVRAGPGCLSTWRASSVITIRSCWQSDCRSR